MAPTKKNYFRQFLVGISRLGFLLFVTCSAPALWVFVGEPGWPGYFPALNAHVWAGYALLAIALPALLAHLWITGSRPLLPLIVAAIPLGGLWWLFGRGAGLHLVLDGYLYRIVSAGNAAGLSLLALVLLAVAVQLLPRLERPVPTRWSGVLLALLAGTAMGLAITGMEGRGDTRWGALIGHSALGLISLAAIAPHFRVIREKWGGSRSKGTAAVLLLVSVTAGLWALQTDRKYYSGFREDGAERRWETLKLTAGQAPEHPFPSSVLGQSASCGDSGCHEEITAQWQGSTHRFSADNALFQAAVAGLVRERGAEAAIACANCHDPERALAGTVVADYAEGHAAPGDGVSCIACHAAYDAPSPTGNGIARYRLPKTYPGDSPEAQKRNLLSDPRQHRQSMQASRHLMSNEGCGVCHRLDLKTSNGAHVLLQNPYRAEKDPGPARDENEPEVSCSLCHMPTQTRQEGGRIPLYDHRWPGVNVDLPSYVTHPNADHEALSDVQAATQRFMQGGGGTAHMPDEFSENPEFQAYAEMARGAGLLHVSLDAVREGPTVSLTVTTTNHRAAHPFPIGALDLQEVWLHVVVRNAEGEVLATIGELEGGRVPPGAPRLGARELDQAGKPLREHRLFELDQVRDKRVLWPGAPEDDVVSLQVDSAAGALDIEARWLFRRVNPDFAEFALGTPQAIAKFGVHPIGRAKVIVP